MSTENDTIDAFFCDYVSDRDIPAHQAVPVDREQAQKLLRDLPASDGNFVGFVRDDETLQFMWMGAEGETELVVDIPVPADDGSYTRTVSPDEASRAVERFFDSTVEPTELFEGLQFMSHG